MLTFGMIGGGKGAFIGAVHRMAATLDGEAAFVAGALSSSPERARESGRELGLASDRNYGAWRDMLESERARPAGERIDFVSIVTPNDAHYEPARAFAEAGFNVVLDKPMVRTGEEASELVRAVEKSGVVLAVTYNYTGYPMVKHAASLLRSGALGAIRKVFVEYHQGWLASKLEETGQKQAAWRVDPARSGAGGAIGDIGSHAENLVATLTGLEVDSLCADLNTFVPGRALDDDAAVLLRFRNGARGVLTASQVCVGEENGLSIRVYTEKGGIAWRQENPNLLEVTDETGRRIITRGTSSDESAKRATRLPPGHPEGFIEAFANIYRGVFESIRARREGRPARGLGVEFPTVHDGARGVRFIERVVESSRAGGTWLSFR